MSTTKQSLVKGHEEQGILVLTLLEQHLQSDEMTRALYQDLVAASEGRAAPKIVVDFQHVKAISAAGLRAMLNFRRYVRDKEGQLLLCGLAFEVADVFYTTRLASTSASTIIPFAMTTDVAAALAHLTKG